MPDWRIQGSPMEDPPWRRVLSLWGRVPFRSSSLSSPLQLYGQLSEILIPEESFFRIRTWSSSRIHQQVNKRPGKEILENFRREGSYRFEEQRRPVLTRRICIKKSRFNLCQISPWPIWKSKWCTTQSPQPRRKISSVLRRIQNMSVLLSADVREAFFKIRVAPASRHLSLFLMDYDTKTQQLTAKVTEHSKLVTIQA